MITVQDLKNGTTFQMDGSPYVVLKYEHIKVGRGSATIKVKIRNLKNGLIAEKNFINSAKVEEINTKKRQLQYLYRDGKDLYFMDPKNYDQISLNESILGNGTAFLKDGMDVDILFWDEKPLTVDLPPKMELKVTETDPGVKGNSAANVYKPAILENGLQVKVPLFINSGDKIRVDTRTGEYVERAK
ncbi:elongation factor P [Candidatus Woesebacteria bacterium RIFCSPLOWO2_01_FULL_39_23]|uniref:Elongation factor P n=1 Tax=Candidatus Woesebacteria bacterium RIFCSPHIGHO2_01_FULL_40_22 TaxID=1802499 RepID=A0A1F7YJG2_9BACT|nr:MAG: elongation factor P [Candidatus Woesebacteria bacterium RBG_16_40_11]OGM27330.1 MAG: elongation factor P [Candidatus Woesebacteria bacterium RIFCSPHIGHO2_01_FULL_40_22]OGM36973.1 MAG: elongation factor P [Candidatus Woesebacteria bacterium RIFCSPHIGHO2_12_FULL_38_9]OGM62502.1 MAG: elongation factor P [Candidatus Woesebacteria bacterium RIFCSPLOWO2_01_FULL_39_23]